MKDYDMYGFTC